MQDRDVEQLLLEKQELEEIFNSSCDEIFVTDGQGRTLRVNKVCEQNYGVPAEALIGQNVRQLQQQGFFNHSVALQAIQEKKRVTAMQTTRSGKKLIVTANPLLDEQGRVRRVILNSRDITELVNLRRQLLDSKQKLASYQAELDKLRRLLGQEKELVAVSRAMQDILTMVEKVAQLDTTVLLEGESGVGKGLVARRLHELSPRRQRPFVVINCGAIPENLVESELFGYAPGAFTGAHREGKAGLIEAANGGTLFLDEITELPLNVQVKLLHVLQDRRVMRLGENRYREVDIRVIAASNQQVYRQVQEQKFREDLFYRLHVVPIIIPPLRHRREDIGPLAEYFLQILNQRYQINKQLGAGALEALQKYHWPGNVRELENVIERAVVTADESVIERHHLPEYILTEQQQFRNVFVVDICPLKQATEEVERQILQKALQKHRNTYRMARALQVNQSTIVRKLKKYFPELNLRDK